MSPDLDGGLDLDDGLESDARDWLDRKLTEAFTARNPSAEALDLLDRQRSWVQYLRRTWVPSEIDQWIMEGLDL